MPDCRRGIWRRKCWPPRTGGAGKHFAGARFHCQIAAWQTELRRDLMAKWKERLSQPSAGHATIAVVRPLFEEWLERRHGILTFRLTQVFTGHGCFGTFLFGIRRDDKPSCHHCVDRPEDTVEHTVEVCPAWAEHRRDLVEAIGGGGLSHPVLVEAMVSGGPEVWEAVTSFCEAVTLAKEVAERERERLATDSLLRRRRRRRPVCRMSNADLQPPKARAGEQRVARRPIRTQFVSTARCVPRSPQGAVSTH